MQHVPMSQASIISKLNRLAWTARYLKSGQITAQVRHRVGSRLQREHASGQAVAEFRGCLWPRDVRFLPPGAQDNRANGIRQGTLRFLNSEVRVGFPPRWDCQLPKLWQYNLHYFEWLWVLGYEEARAAVIDWIQNYPLAKGAIGWEPYPTSLRLVNWATVFWGRFREQVEGDHAFLEKLWSSIFRQVQWLARHLETHLLGNHYFENGAALAFVGSCFEGEQPRRWFEKGHSILREQIPEQVLPDGMHFELSPMYHCRMIYVLAMLAATGNERLKRLIAEPLGRMLKALDAVCHPDGGIALLNDSALGICNEPDELRSFCSGLPGMAPLAPPMMPGCFALPDAGYYGWRDLKGNYVLCDFGRIGPDYIPGHAHADIFSFELSLQGHRVIVDTGVHDYEVSQARRYCRSTPAHNTVEVNGQDQCEMWASFRVAGRGYPRDVQWRPSRKGFFISGWHDGYHRLPGRSAHHRSIEGHCENGLTVTDRITSSRAVNAVARLHLHPTCTVVRMNEAGIEVEHPKGHVRITCPNGGIVRIEDGWYFPQFSLKERNKVVALENAGTDIELCCHVQNVT